MLRFDRPVAPLLQALSARGILGGYDLGADYPELGHALLVCATEMRTAEDIAALRRSAGRRAGAPACGLARGTRHEAWNR